MRKAFDSDDYLKTLQLRESVLRVPIGQKLSMADTSDEAQQLHFGIFKDCELIACVVAKPLDTRATIKLRQMAVSPCFQGQSFGKTLIGSTEKILRQKGYMSIEMSARQTAIGFYEKLGYRTVGDVFMEIGIAHIAMHKYLL